MPDIEEAVIEQIHKNLVEFGYKSLTLDHTRDAIKAIQEGAKPKGIIQMFARDMLIKNGLME